MGHWLDGIQLFNQCVRQPSVAVSGYPRKDNLKERRFLGLRFPRVNHGLRRYGDIMMERAWWAELSPRGRQEAESQEGAGDEKHASRHLPSSYHPPAPDGPLHHDPTSGLTTDGPEPSTPCHFPRALLEPDGLNTRPRHQPQHPAFHPGLLGPFRFSRLASRAQGVPSGTHAHCTHLAPPGQ